MDADLREKLDRAIGEVMTAHPKGGMTIGWFLVTEQVTADGDRWLDWAWADGMKTWQVRGYLHEALDSQTTGEIVTSLREDD